jgi:DNA replication initiation complex subunit (GINS family)
MSEDSENVLTFSELRKKQKKENKQQELVDLDDKFLLRAANYFQQKKQAEGESREYQNARRVLDKIISLREEKIVKKARLSSNTGSVQSSKLHLLPEEQELFRDMKDMFDRHHGRVEEMIESTEKGLSDMEEEASEEVTEEIDKEPEQMGEIENDTEEVEASEEEDEVEVEDGYNLVEITSSVPEFMGTDLEAYGPFDEGEEVEIPEDNAEILVNRGNAEVVD